MFCIFIGLQLDFAAGGKMAMHVNSNQLICVCNNGHFSFNSYWVSTEIWHTEVNKYCIVLYLLFMCWSSLSYESIFSKEENPTKHIEKLTCRLCFEYRVCGFHIPAWIYTRSAGHLRASACMVLQKLCKNEYNKFILHLRESKLILLIV